MEQINVLYHIACDTRLRKVLIRCDVPKQKVEWLRYLTSLPTPIIPLCSRPVARLGTAYCSVSSAFIRSFHPL